MHQQHQKLLQGNCFVTYTLIYFTPFSSPRKPTPGAITVKLNEGVPKLSSLQWWELFQALSSLYYSCRNHSRSHLLESCCIITVQVFLMNYNVQVHMHVVLVVIMFLLYAIICAQLVYMVNYNAHCIEYMNNEMQQ